MWNNSSSSSEAISETCYMFPVILHLSLSMALLQTLFILPLSFYVLFLGYQQWRPQRSFRSSSHSDVFTYNLDVMRIIATVGDFLYCAGIFCKNPRLIHVGYGILSIIYPGEVFIHSLTCVDRHLAVVHPITYMKLKQTTGIRICNVSIGIVWLLCVVYIGIQVAGDAEHNQVLYICFLILSVSVVTFCCTSVIRVLIRPRPGDLDRVDQSKRRAFHTVVAITATLLVWFVTVLMSLTLDHMHFIGQFLFCVIHHSLAFVAFPCSLVLDVLLIQRTGKFTFGKK